MLDNNGLSKYIQITKCGLPLISIYYLGGYTFYLSGQPSPDVSLQGAGGNVERSQVTLRNNTAVSLNSRLPRESCARIPRLKSRVLRDEE